MNESKISVRYAKALFQSAKEANKLEEVKSDISLLETAFATEGFVRILESPIIKTSEKVKLFKDVFSKSIGKLSLDFFLLVLRNRREIYLSAMMRNFIHFYKDDMGIKSAELTVSAKISSEQEKKMIELLKKVYKVKIELQTKISPEIIGGFILKVEDEQFDASVSTSLSRIEKELLETSIDKIK